MLVVLVDWYLSLFVMCKAWHQYKRLRVLASLNSPQCSECSQCLRNLIPTTLVKEVCNLYIYMYSGKRTNRPVLRIQDVGTYHNFKRKSLLSHTEFRRSL